MITKIRVSNFYSIGKEMELDFLKSGKKSVPGYFRYKDDEKVSLINGFFGANASGKSNILRAITTLIRLIYNIRNNADERLVTPNMHKDYVGLPTKLGIDFLFGTNYYKYDLEIMNGHDIVKEELYLTNKENKWAQPKSIFIRDESGIRFGPDYRDYENYLSLVAVSSNQTFISHLITNVKAKVLIDFEDNREAFFLKNDDYDTVLPFFMASLIKVSSVMGKNQADEFLEDTKNIVRCFDDSIKKIKIDKRGENVFVKVEHNDFTDDIDINQESAGTRELFCHIYDILKVFKRGGVVVYDETSRYYHPEIEMALLALFKDKEVNRNNAQIFFASHNHNTFGLLGLDQAFIVEKTLSYSEYYKVSDIEDIKKRDNIKKKYGLGLLGGSPDVGLFDYVLKQSL